MTNNQNSNTGSNYRISHHDRWLDPAETVDRWPGYPGPTLAHTHHVTYLLRSKTNNRQPWYETWHSIRQQTPQTNRQTWDNPDFTSTELTPWICVVTTTKHQHHQQYQQHQTTYTCNAIKLSIFVCYLFCNYYSKARQTPISWPLSWDNLGKPTTERLHQSGI